MSNTYHRNQPISSSFLSYGNDGIGIHRANEIRANEQQRVALTSRQPGSGTFAIARRRLGALLITAGERTLGEPAVTPIPAS